VESRDKPLLSMVAVTAASLAALEGQHRDAALLLGAASRLRGAHDRTDQRIRQISDQIRAELGEAGFAAAYEIGWELDGKTASAQVDPARLRREALPAADSASWIEASAQARRA
jgi:hypothetical protein